MKAADLFSGCGGVSCGLANAGFDVAVAVEVDPDAVAIYRSQPKFNKVAIINKDICTISGKDILENGGIKDDELYLLAGCPPCQNFSIQNKNNGEKRKKFPRKDKERLLLEFLKKIKEIKPPFILMENVPGIKSSEKGEILKDFLKELKNENSKNDKSKYHVVSDVLLAADYGVPQLRKRFVLHAVRWDIYEKLKALNIEFKLPEPTHSKTGENGLSKWLTVGETFKGLPKIKAGDRYFDKKIKNHYCANLSEINIKRIRIIRENGGSRKGLPDNLILKCHRDYKGHQDVYGIMNASAPSPTITGGCLSYSKGRFGHPTQDRAISVREAARLQTFPDEFIFGESLTKSALQIGNAVPVKLVEASATLLKYYIEQLKKNNG